MIRASCFRYLLHLKQPAGTSRGVLSSKETWFIKAWNMQSPSIFGIGEAAVFRGLSCDDREGFEEQLNAACHNISDPQWLRSALQQWPSIRFGVETALQDLNVGGRRILHKSPFTEGKEGIPINGLIWMGKKEEMLRQIGLKLDAGYHCLKLKVGAIDLEEEIGLLSFIRQQYPASRLEIRLDANGAFNDDNALGILERLSEYSIHSIEQPVKPGNWSAMRELVAQSPIAIALDEELIGVNDKQKKEELLKSIMPPFIILKPALHGGFSGSDEWVSLADSLGIGYWFTSALESNIGLNAIAQHVAMRGYHMPQGLGTGSLFTNNPPSPLTVRGDKLWHDPALEWDFSMLHPL